MAPDDPTTPRKTLLNWFVKTRPRPMPLPLVKLGEARYYLERMRGDQRMVLFNDKRVEALHIRPAT
jgi:hypothetical protein